MKKTTLLLFLVSLVLTSVSCIISGQEDQEETGLSASHLDPSDFELWEAGKLPSIRLYSGRESLTNFQEAFTIQIKGQDNGGVPINGFQEYLRKIDKTADASREIESIDLPNKYLSGVREYIQFEGFRYYVHDALREGRVCKKNEIPDDTRHISDVHVTQTLVAITPGEKLDENVDLNGVPADLYTIEDMSLLFARELHQVDGKVWIAREPAYFLKAEGRIEGVLEFQNTKYTGDATFSYEVKDFGQVQVELPALCAHPPEDYLPLPSNAEDIVDFSGMITFSSPDPLEEVVGYYLDELDALGWQVQKPSEDAYEKVIQADILTPEGVQIFAEVKIIPMGDGSTKVALSWESY
jgi:hypothetical protein